MTLKEINKEVMQEDGRFAHGALTAISKLSGFSTFTVAQVLRRRQVKLTVNTKLKVLDAAEQYVIQQRQLREQLAEKL